MDEDSHTQIFQVVTRCRGLDAEGSSVLKARSNLQLVRHATGTREQRNIAPSGYMVISQATEGNGSKNNKAGTTLTHAEGVDSQATEGNEPLHAKEVVHQLHASMSSGNVDSMQNEIPQPLQTEAQSLESPTQNSGKQHSPTVMQIPFQPGDLGNNTDETNFYEDKLEHRETDNSYQKEDLDDGFHMEIQECYSILRESKKERLRNSEVAMFRMRTRSMMRAKSANPPTSSN